MFNLCSEKTYDTSFFHGRVERVLIDDHNVPTLKQMLEFADTVNHDVGAHEDCEPLETAHVLHAVLHLLSIVQQGGYEGVVGLLHFPIIRA